MTTRSGPIYEVTFFVDRDAVDAHKQWLEEHVRSSLRIAAVSDCRVFPITDDELGRAGRVCQHIIETDQALEQYVDDSGADIESDIASTFGDAVTVSSRILREDDTHDLPPGKAPDCLNCGTHLRGQYCGSCGQRSGSRLISLWELISDAFGDLFEIDSRLWKTLVPLLVKPGLLTHDYLAGRRARYMPPFRMYLVMSLVFFVVAFFDPREELGLLFEAPPQSTTSIEKDASEGDAGVEFDETECDIESSDVEELPDFLARRLTAERLQQICERIELDEGRALLDRVLDNVPVALIFLLPLMALVLKALYPLSHRYYVEHLLFFVHLHAFVFLILTLQILFVRLTALLRVPDLVTILAIVAVSVYVPIYLFVAIRRVYGQGRLVTTLKYIVLTFAYALGFFATMLGVLAIAAFSI